ncbi:hypothetical protein L211DRAFT_893608 [Terfezia boudieri ATCC MYA-4762]|uniref:Uncharacterized protein n=1 Tax=Terfezia boudieri ATCC MYA-4762 TaxID=1051890 RepID=A0A3N4LBQ3_9PEZI|nr:hypothetical protein L211DRAFT_893608 [Terfezia boudieri ATCC MYA-4762]
MSQNKPPGDGDREKPKTQPHVLDRIYAETAPARLATPPIVEGEDPPSYEQAITPRGALEAIQRPSGERLRNQAGSYGPNPSELPNRGDIDPMTGRRVVYLDPRTGWHIRDGSNDIEIPKEDSPPAPEPTRQRRALTPEISRQGLDSAYALLTHSELPNDPTINAMTGDYQVASGPAVTPGQPSREYVPTGLSEGAKLRVMDADTSRNQSSVDLPSGSQSLAASLRSKASLTATKASAIGSKISDGLDKLVAKTRRKKKRKPRVKESQEDEEESENEGGVMDIKAFEKDTKHRKEDDSPDSPHPALSSRGGSATEVLNLFGFDPVECEPIPVPCYSQISALTQTYYPQIQQTRPMHHIHPGAVGRLTLQPVSLPVQSHQEPVPTFHSLASDLEKNKRVPTSTGSYTSPCMPQSQVSNLAGANSPSLSKSFVPKVNDINSGLLLRQEITPGKLVKVKYAYSAKRADEFELEIDLLLIVLLIASDNWALGSKYEDALDYIATREEFLPPDGSKLHMPCAPVPEEKKAGQFKGRLPMMRFFPLEAVQLVQPYEWAFHPYSPTLTSLKARSILTPGSKRGVSHYKLHNPPLRGISKKPDLLYGENKRLVGIGYEKFVAEVLQKIIEEPRYSMQHAEEVSQVYSKENTPISSPTCSGWTSSSSPTSELAYTVASSPTKTVTEVGKLSPEAPPVGGTLPTGPATTQVHSIAPNLDFGTETAEGIAPVKLARCEECELVDEELQTLELVDNRISKLIDGLSGKPGKKHLLKQSWRWATKRKEKLFKTMLKRKHKGEAPADGDRSDTPYPCSGYSDSIVGCRNARGPPDEFLNPRYLSPATDDEDTKDFSRGYLMSENSEYSGETWSPLESCNFPTSVNQNTSARISRPSVRNLFATETCVLNPSHPTPHMAYPERTRNTSDASNPSHNNHKPRIAKANPPKLSINTHLLSPSLVARPSSCDLSPIQLPLARSATKEPVYNDNKLTSLPPISSPRQANSAARVGIHEWYRAKINSPNSKSPNDTEVLGVGDSTISEYLKRGRERERSNFDKPESALSPTCTRDWAARGLIAKVKRARESMRGIYSAVEECDDNVTIMSAGEGSLGGKENKKVIIAQADATEQRLLF